MTNPAYTRAFNEGCDARLRGEPLKRYGLDYDMETDYWRQGWRHVDRCWASGELITWTVRPLPEVGETQLVRV